jgi:hypothetical protein
MTIKYFLILQMWITIGLAVPLFITIYSYNTPLLPGILFSIVIVNIVLALLGFPRRNQSVQNKSHTILSTDAAAISCFAWNVFAAYMFFWEDIQDVTILMFWVVGGLLTYLAPLLLLWIHSLVYSKLKI